MSVIKELYGRLANDTSTRQSLFTGKFADVGSVELQLSEEAEGTANFAIYENGQRKVDQMVVKGGSVVHSAEQPNAILEFYVNYYDGSDLPVARAVVE